MIADGAVAGQVATGQRACRLAGYACMTRWLLTAFLVAAGCTGTLDSDLDEGGDGGVGSDSGSGSAMPDPAECHAWLTAHDVGFTAGPSAPGIEDPVTATLPFAGLAFRSGGAARTSMFADCALVKSLVLAAPIIKGYGFVEVTDLGVYNYRCINNAGTPPNCTSGLSEHSFGNAIDLASFKRADGTSAVVKTDWVIDPADDTCEAATVAGPDRVLHEMICALKAANVWNIVLTPNYNALHRDHFHADLTDGSDFIE